MGWGAGIGRATVAALAPAAVVVLASGLAVVPAEVDGTAGPSTAIDPVSVLRASTVLVATTTCDGARTGSGVFLAGSVVTNAHVVDGASAVEVRSVAGMRRAVGRARVVTGIDTAVLDPAGVTGVASAPGSPATDLELRTTPLRPGEDVWLAGHPDGGPLVVTRTVVRRRRPREVWADPPVAVELDATVRPGQSGSPVVDRAGRLAGIVYASSIDDRRALVVDGAALAAALDALRSGRARSGVPDGEDGLVDCPRAAGD